MSLHEGLLPSGRTEDGVHLGGSGPGDGSRVEEGEQRRMSGPFVGKRVRIHGLLSRPELNGSVGLVTSYDDASNRYNVEVQSNLELDPTRVIFAAIKPQNLEPTGTVQTETKIVIFQHAREGRKTTVEKPTYESWFASRGVSEADFDEVMLEIIAPYNALQGRLWCYIAVAILSGGRCAELSKAEAQTIPCKVRASLDKFHAKYPSIKGSLLPLVVQQHLQSRMPPGLVFTGPALASPAAREDPLETLTELKSMLDQGMITRAEYDTKKTEVLSRM